VDDDITAVWGKKGTVQGKMYAPISQHSVDDLDDILEFRMGRTSHTPTIVPSMSNPKARVKTPGKYAQEMIEENLAETAAPKASQRKQLNPAIVSKQAGGSVVSAQSGTPVTRS
jgi:hypothetical protein